MFVVLPSRACRKRELCAFLSVLGASAVSGFFGKFTAETQSALRLRREKTDKLLSGAFVGKEEGSSVHECTEGLVQNPGFDPVLLPGVGIGSITPILIPSNSRGLESKPP